MFCPSCGKAIAGGSAFCMHCGKPTGLAAASVELSAGLVAPPQPNAPVCPSCHQLDAVRHIRGVVAEGVTLGETTSRSSGYGVGIAGAVGSAGKSYAVSGQHYSGTTHAQTTEMTLLAARLASLSEGLDAYVRRSMPPEPAYLRKPREKDLAVAEVFHYWTAEFRFRKTLLANQWC